jgi:hypothetical protein
MDSQKRELADDRQDKKKKKKRWIELITKHTRARAHTHTNKHRKTEEENLKKNKKNAPNLGPVAVELRAGKLRSRADVHNAMARGVERDGLGAHRFAVAVADVCVGRRAVLAVGASADAAHYTSDPKPETVEIVARRDVIDLGREHIAKANVVDGGGQRLARGGAVTGACGMGR